VTIQRLWLAGWTVHRWIAFGLALLLVPIAISGALLVWRDQADTLNSVLRDTAETVATFTCNAGKVCYRPNRGTADLGVQILKRQPLGLSLLCWTKPKSSLTSETQAPQRTQVGVTQDGGGEWNLTCDPINWLK
jgi:hypothetical protein